MDGDGESPVSEVPIVVLGKEDMNDRTTLAGLS
jgi:hypothetical protein